MIKNNKGTKVKLYNFIAWKAFCIINITDVSFFGKIEYVLLHLAIDLLFFVLSIILLILNINFD